jgi:hypothetical protein
MPRNQLTIPGGPAIKKLCRKKIGGKGENLVWPLLPKNLPFLEFFEPITTQSQPNHVSIFVHSTFAGLMNSLFFARFGINTPSPKSRDGWELLEPILVFFIHHFVNTSGTCRWWLGQSNLFCKLAPAEKLITRDQKIARHAIFPTPILGNPPPTVLAPPALKYDNQLTMVTQEDVTGNGGVSEGGEGRGGRWWGGGQEQQSPTTTMTKSPPLLYLQLKK